MVVVSSPMGRDNKRRPKRSREQAAEQQLGGLRSAEEHAFRADSLLEAQDYAGAALEGERALDCLPLIARAALVRGRALLHPAMTKMVEEGEPPSMGLLDEVGRAFMLSARLDPDCEESKEEVECLQKLRTHLRPPVVPAGVVVGTSPTASPSLDVIVVGAGAAGVGCALMLTKTFGLDAARVLLIERGDAVGESFRRWPAEMRFISPSFNQQGWTSSFDLNSIAHGTSPAYSLHTEHPSGDQYADYLNALALAADLQVRTQTEVISVEAEGTVGGSPLFSVSVRSKPGGEQNAHRARATEKLTARYVVWAAGEFQYPREGSGSLAGAELCMHNSRVRSWASLPGDDFVLIGGCVVSTSLPHITLLHIGLHVHAHVHVHVMAVFTCHPIASHLLSGHTPPPGTRAGLMLRSIWPRLASAAPCSPRPPRGTSTLQTRRPSWHRTLRSGCAR